MTQTRKLLLIAAMFIAPPLLLIAQQGLYNSLRAGLDIGWLYWLTGAAAALYAWLLLGSASRGRDRAAGICGLVSALLLALLSLNYSCSGGLALPLPLLLTLAFGAQRSLAALFAALNLISGLLLLRRPGGRQREDSSSLRSSE